MLHAADGLVADAGDSPVLLRCVNLSPWLEPEPYLIGKGGLRGLRLAPSELRRRFAELVGSGAARAFWRRWEDVFVTEEDFARLARQGFNCARVPVNYKDFATEDANGAIRLSDAGLAPLDHAVTWGARHGLYVIVDLHVAPGGQNPYPIVSDLPPGDRVPRLWKGPTARRNRESTVALWRALAGRYAGAASVGGYDLINEPDLPAGAPKGDLPRLYDAVVAAIRSVDPDHMVILEGDGLARDFSAFPPPSDPNIMYEFHEYAIFNPAWDRPNQKALAPFLRLRDSTRMPLWLGEFGEESPEWQAQMVRLMKANRIGWAV